MRSSSFPLIREATREEQLIAALVGTARHRAANGDRARRLAAHVDVGRLTTRLEELRVLGIVGPRALGLLPAADHQRLKQRIDTYANGLRTSARIHATLLRSIGRAHAEAGIDAIPLKGTDLAQRLYGDLGARPSADLDILVRRQQLAASSEILARLGYQTLPADAHPWRRSIHHELHHPSPAMPPVELHWRVERYCGSPFSDGIIERAIVDQAGRLRARPVDELALLLMIAARDGFKGLRLMADIAAWWDRYGDDVADGGLARIALDHPPLARALSTAAVFAQRIVGLPIERILEADRVRHRRSRLALRLADPLVAVDGPGVVLVEGLLSDRSAIRSWVRYSVTPSRGHVATIYGLQSDQRLRTAVMAALHPARLAARSARPLLAACRATRAPCERR